MYKYTLCSLAVSLLFGSSVELFAQDYTRARSNAIAIEGMAINHGQFGDFHHPGMDPTRGPVTFLGLHVTPVDPTVTAQLGLPEGMGLAVRFVVPDSPADKAGLRRHDILRKLEDQLLIHPMQLQVLVRNYEAGEKVSLTLLRAGREETMTAELEKRDPREIMRPHHDFRPPQDTGESGEEGGVPHNRRPEKDQGRWQPATPNAFPAVPFRGQYARDMNVIFNPDGPYPVDHLRVLVGSGMGASSPTLADIEHRAGNRQTVIRMRDRQVIYADGDGDIVLTTDGDHTHLKAIDKTGSVIYEGPVNTPEERERLDPEIRGKLMRLEATRDLDFKMDPGKAIFIGEPGAGPI